MAFSENSAALKLNFAFDVAMFVLGLVSLISMATSATDLNGNCLLFSDPLHTTRTAPCSFSVTAGALIILAALVLFAMDWRTYQHSESCKKRNLSVAAFVVAIAMSLLSFSAVAVIDLGIKKTCRSMPFCSNIHRIHGSSEFHAGMVCSSLAGVCFLAYAINEYRQYRSRPV